MQAQELGEGDGLADVVCCYLGPRWLPAVVHVQEVARQDGVEPDGLHVVERAAHPAALGYEGLRDQGLGQGSSWATAPSR